MYTEFKTYCPKKKKKKSMAASLGAQNNKSMKDKLYSRMLPFEHK